MLKESHCLEQRLDITTRHLGEMVLSPQPGEARPQLDAGPWDLNPEPGPPPCPTASAYLCTFGWWLGFERYACGILSP